MNHFTDYKNHIHQVEQRIAAIHCARDAIQTMLERLPKDSERLPDLQRQLAALEADMAEAQNDLKTLEPERNEAEARYLAERLAQVAQEYVKQAHTLLALHARMSALNDIILAKGGKGMLSGHAVRIPAPVETGTDDFITMDATPFRDEVIREIESLGIKTS